jgi:hypothetical protein
MVIPSFRQPLSAASWVYSLRFNKLLHSVRAALPFPMPDYLRNAKALACASADPGSVFIFLTTLASS